MFELWDWFQTKKRFFPICFNRAGTLVVDILPEMTAMTNHRHSTATKLLRLSRSSDQTWEPQEHYYSTTMLLPTKQGPQFTIRRGKSTSPAPPTLQPRLITMWLLAVFLFEKWHCWKEGVFCCCCEFKTLQDRWNHNSMYWSTTTPSRCSQVQITCCYSFPVSVFSFSLTDFMTGHVV